MMRKSLYLLLIFALPLVIGCQKDNKEKDKTVAKYAPDLYWEDSYSGPKGLQLGTLASKGEARMFLAGEPIYCTGVNCYNLFVQCHESDNMATTQMEQTVEVLAKNQVPIVRFSCSPYYSHQMTFYFDQKQTYLSNLEKLATLCDQKHILLIPSIFWNTDCIPGVYSEEMANWGKPDSQTYKLMEQYTIDVVNVLKDHKCIAAWEFGNEFNLQADIPHNFRISATDIEIAYKGFTALVQSLDKENRIVTTGNSVMRNAQYNLLNSQSWSNDSFQQYIDITKIMTPDPMGAVSEHIYEEARSFSDLGTLNRTYQIQRAKEAAAKLGKGYYVGEFTGPKTAKMDSTVVKAHYSTYLSQKVQISLIWNYALKGDVEYSFADNDRTGGTWTFSLIRRNNRRFKEMKAE